MTDVVISGRIPNELMDQLKEFDKSNTEILNEALRLYVSQKTIEKQCIQKVYNKTRCYDYDTIRLYVDRLIADNKRFFKDFNEKED
jgi:hypothetical protein